MTLDQHPIWEIVRDRIKVEWRGDTACGRVAIICADGDCWGDLLHAMSSLAAETAWQIMCVTLRFGH